jgi:serine/threonine protein kinase
MKFGRYEIVKKLGEGAMGVVYQAHDPHIDREVALKVLKEDRVESENFVQRFLKEAKAIGRLNHPNIVTVYDIGQDHKTVYIAMEFLEGKPLDEVIGEKKLGLQEVVNIGSQLAQALGYAHNKGIVHRDIKPTNIILTSDNQVKLTDFGIARIEDPSAVQMTQAGEILGTPSYMSPEQVLGKPVDGRSDLFSLGVFLYRITTGKRPFRGNNLGSTFRAITADTPEIPLKLDPTVSKPLSSLIMKSLNKDPKDRFQTGEKMKEALLACLEKSPEPTSATKPQKQKLNMGLLFLAIFLLVGAVGGFIYFKFFMPCLKVVPQATS